MISRVIYDLFKKLLIKNPTLLPISIFVWFILIGLFFVFVSIYGLVFIIEEAFR